MLFPSSVSVDSQLANNVIRRLVTKYIYETTATSEMEQNEML